MVMAFLEAVDLIRRTALWALNFQRTRAILLHLHLKTTHHNLGKWHDFIIQYLLTSVFVLKITTVYHALCELICSTFHLLCSG